MAKTTKSTLLSKLGNQGRQAFENHKADETVIPGGGDLPAGIENGIAQLVACGFSEYKEGENAGELFFRAAGVVIAPKFISNADVGKIKVEGGQTSIMEPICETPRKSRKTVDEHLKWILNQLRLLGVDTAGVDFDNLEATVAALKEAAPYFRFRTWESKPTAEFPNPRTNHTWLGHTDYEPSNDDDVEESEEAAVAASAPQKVTPKTAPSPAKASPAVSKTTSNPSPKNTTRKEPEPVADDSDDAPADLSELATFADADDEDAQLKIAAEAKAAGISDDDVAGAENWTEVVGLIVAASSGDSVVIEASEGDTDYAELGTKADEEGDEYAINKLTAEAEEKGLDPNEYGSWMDLATALSGTAPAEEDVEEWEPKAEEVYLYKPAGAKKPVECEVVKVFPDKQTVNLKDLTTKKSYKGVVWADIKQ